MARLSCHDFDDNQVLLQLFILAYNLANCLRTLALPEAVRHWSLTTLQTKLIKIGAKVVRPVDSQQYRISRPHPSARPHPAAVKADVPIRT